MNRSRQRGVALIITLIMLAIITVVTLILLGVARRNRAGVSLSSSQTDAEFATETAFQRAKAEMVAQIMSGGSMVSYGLTVSRGADIYDAANGWKNYAPPLRDPAGSEFGPLIVNTNRPGENGPLDSRFFLDLNRDGQFQPSDTNDLREVVRAGDPEWIYIFDRPDLPYGRNNPAIARYAFIVLPTGKALDLNVNHNAVVNPQAPATQGFSRNQGVGPWEINLAAALHEIEPAIWDYEYRPSGVPGARGTAFDDAASLVFYRTHTNMAPFAPPSALGLFGPAAQALAFDRIDDFGDDLTPGGLVFEDDAFADDISNKPFPGAEPTQHHFSHQDLFDPIKTSPLFVTRLRQALNEQSNAGTNAPYRFYSLLSQLTADTGTEVAGDRIHLNWVDRGPFALTNFVSWDTNPITQVIFLTNVAERLFRQQINEFNSPTTPLIRSLFEVPVAPVNYYSSAMHRFFQLAANTLEATRADPLPLVFLPQFRVVGTNTFLNGFVMDYSPAGVDAWAQTNLYGIPAVIGAKKCLPNFNEFTMRTDVLATRKLQLTREDASKRPNGTNQMYMIGISNLVAAEIWYGCSDIYMPPTTLFVRNRTDAWMTNYAGRITLPTNFFIINLQYQTNFWRGRDPIENNGGFSLPLHQTQIILPESAYRFATRSFDPVNTNLFELGTGFQIPELVLTLSNRFNYYAVDDTSGRVFDIAVLNAISSVDINNEILGGSAYDGGATFDNAPVSTAMVDVWRTNLFRNVPAGIRNQVEISLGNAQTSLSDWNSYSRQAGSPQDKEKAIDGFRAFFKLSPHYTTNITNSALSMQAPFNPAAKISRIATWQANDPLVHYHPDDIALVPTNSSTSRIVPPNRVGISNVPPATLGYLNRRYSPWGGNPRREPGVDDSAHAFVLSLKDPCVYSPDDWSFPSNKMASVGWLGRVHRGTPWQTVYFKSEIAPEGAWVVELGNNPATHPTNDWRLADVFTTALTETMTKGLLSINNPDLAAWSAVLSGVVVLSNIVLQPQLYDPRGYAPVIIEPTGGDTNSSLNFIWQSIQQVREAQPTKTFTNLSQILTVPALTVESPYLNQLLENQVKYGIDDFAYERIPQQILGLLRLGDSRFAIYAYGQALKPAEIDPSDGSVRNYQVTAEHATRTVLRVEGSPQNPRTVVESFNILPPD